MIDRVLDLLVPLRCVACGRRAEPPWCDACAAAAAARGIDQATACDRCAGPVGRAACWIGPVPVRRCVARYRYGGVVADAIVSGKVRGHHAVWAPLGRSLAPLVSAADLDVVTWVPVPARRRRDRGFDHARLLAEGLAAAIELPVWPVLEAGDDGADRGRVDAANRPTVRAGAFRPVGAFGGARVLLVDDVLTTGATVRACAGALRAGGAAEVDVALLARAGTHQLGEGPGRSAGPT